MFCLFQFQTMELIQNIFNCIVGTDRTDKISSLGYDYTVAELIAEMQFEFPESVGSRINGTPPCGIIWLMNISC